MRAGPTAEAVAGSIGWQPQVSAWFGGYVTAENIPVMGGHVTADVTQVVPERLTLTVPRYSPGADGRRFDWRPDSQSHPLARYGQTISVQIKTASSASRTTWTSRVGMYRIQGWTVQGDYSVTVEAVGLLQLMVGNRLSTPLTPRAAGTLASEFRRLLVGPFSLSVDSSLTDRACPQSMAWEDDRLKALYSIAEAWPARLRSTPEGWRLALLAALPTTISTRPLVSLTDGVRGTVVTAPSSDTRDKTYNRVTATCSAPGDPSSTPLSVTVDQMSGDLSTTSAYGVDELKWSSPLATTIASLTASAKTLLADSVRPSRSIKVSVAPDPRLDIDDPVEIITDTNTPSPITYWGWIVGYDLPLTVNDGPMQLNVGISQ